MCVERVKGWGLGVGLCQPSNCSGVSRSHGEYWLQGEGLGVGEGGETMGHSDTVYLKMGAGRGYCVSSVSGRSIESF